MVITMCTDNNVITIETGGSMDDYLRDSVPIEKDVEGDEIHNNNIVYFCLFLVIVFFCITSCITCATPFQLKRTWEVILFLMRLRLLLLLLCISV